MPLVTHIVPEFLVPYMSGFTYTVGELALLVILLTGVAVGIGKKLPLWSYTWVVLAIGSTMTFSRAFMSTLWLDVFDSGPVA
jgi:hypothetical protein